MEERENNREETASDAELQRLGEDFITQKQVLLIQVKKGVLGKEEFLQEAGKHIDQYYHFPATKRKRLLKSFEQYIFGYSRLSPLMDDKSISDIRVVSHDCIRIKREGKRMDAGIAFASEKEYRQFIDYVATRNQVNISNLNAIQRFTDTESHPDFIFRFTLSMPIVNTYSEPYLEGAEVFSHDDRIGGERDAGQEYGRTAGAEVPAGIDSDLRRKFFR